MTMTMTWGRIYHEADGGLKDLFGGFQFHSSHFSYKISGVDFKSI